MARNDTPAPEVGGLFCTPTGTVNKYPCMKCASKTEILAIIALTLYAINNQGDTTVKTILEDGECMACLSDKQMMEAIANILLSIAIAYGYFTDAADALQQAKCLTCTDPKIVKGSIVANTCEYVNGIWPLL